MEKMTSQFEETMDIVRKNKYNVCSFSFAYMDSKRVMIDDLIYGATLYLLNHQMTEEEEKDYLTSCIGELCIKVGLECVTSYFNKEQYNDATVIVSPKTSVVINAFKSLLLDMNS